MNLKKARRDIEDYLNKVGIRKYEVQDEDDKGRPIINLTAQFTHDSLKQTDIDLNIICIKKIFSIYFKFYRVEAREPVLELINSINSTYDVLKLYIDDNGFVNLAFDFYLPDNDNIEDILHFAFDFLSIDEFIEVYDKLYEYFL